MLDDQRVWHHALLQHSLLQDELASLSRWTPRSQQSQRDTDRTASTFPAVDYKTLDTFPLGVLGELDGGVDVFDGRAMQDLATRPRQLWHADVVEAKPQDTSCPSRLVDVPHLTWRPDADERVAFNEASSHMLSRTSRDVHNPRLE
ncbi:MAG TPA: hypothetical protein VNR89_17470 [Roseomonas sp.]|nr:hypothetical protein [Roseomonas sp.]